MHGQGKYTFKDTSIYTGDFKLNMMHGYGIIRYPDGTFYKGNWTNN